MAKRRSKWAVRAGAFFLAVGLLRLLYGLLLRQGINITGDEPSYIMQAQAFTHSTVHILPTIKHDLSTKVFSVYSPNATVSTVEHFNGPTGMVSPFDPGLSLLLAAFVLTLGPTWGGTMGVVCLNVAGFIWLHQRVSRLANLSRVGQVLLSAVFVIPSLLLASTQIYPDLPAGILLAIAVVELALIEVEGRISVTAMVIVTMSVAAAPWLQPKNLVPGTVILVAFALVALRQSARRPLVLVLGVSALSALGFFVYNTHYYGHVLGIPEPPVRFSKAGFELMLGLAFDRDQGLFVQVPYCLIALVGLVAYGIRRMPVTVFAVFGSIFSILVLNGTYTGNPYGGESLSGRFMWTLIPLSLPWIALVIRRWQEVRGRLIFPLAVVPLIWAYQAWPIFAGQHGLWNPMATAYHPWPGWWRGLTRVLPYFSPGSHVFGYPSYGLPLELALDAIAATGILLLMQSGQRWHLQTSADRRGRIGQPQTDAQ